ncbi:contactin isoform X2 [Condylostylus longicornis]|uniref:contactin isoform X2 n=1 Tax=Condylostylus longicornis TaxID=2530218 RepID=UPI00244DED2A|nr:contactin isoform X2 [Condylostylus longicornis]
MQNTSEFLETMLIIFLLISIYLLNNGQTQQFNDTNQISSQYNSALSNQYSTTVYGPQLQQNYPQDNLNLNQYSTLQPQNPYNRDYTTSRNYSPSRDYNINPNSISGNTIGGGSSNTGIGGIAAAGTFYDPNKQYGSTLNNRIYGNNDYNNYGVYGNVLDDIDPNYFCPEYWIAYQQVCYRFIKSPRRTWHEAKKICRAYNSDLINIDSINKHSFILKELILQNQKQNRYWVSARQTSPKSWINDDNSQFLYIEDAFSYDEPSEYRDDLSILQDNRFLLTGRNRDYQYDQNVLNQPLDHLNPYYNNPLYVWDDITRRYRLRDRLVYGFSKIKDKWMFIPTFDDETNLFICESKQLYSPDNINLLADEKRPFDYGIEVGDLEKIPRGPYFIKQPVDTTFDTSKRRLINDVTLSCLTGGYPTPVYYWFKEEYVNNDLKFHQIDPLKDDRYTLSGGNLIIYDPKQILDQGYYHCVAENRFGRIRSESAQLNFGFIMEFNLKRSAEVSDMNWGKALFCDPPQHYPAVKYYWSRDQFLNLVDEDQRVFVSNDGALYFSFIEAVDRANYSCSVQSMVSDTGRNGPFFPLRVHPKSDAQSLIFANSFPKVFPDAPIAGGEIRLECLAFGYPVPSYNWTRRGAPLPRHSYQTSYNRVLIIPNATINDNGDYICTIDNFRKSLEKKITLNIQMKPNFTIPLRDKIKDFNSDVNFVCEAIAIPDVNYTWYKNAERLDIDKLDRDRFIIQDNVLTIKYLDPEKDDGMYQCRAENQLKAVFSSAQLRVLSMKPSFKKRPLESEIYAIYNGNTTIVCDPEAAPRPKFQWKKDGNIIGSGGHRTVLPSGTLIIRQTSRDDEGIYTCVATNSNGTDESKARLIVLQELRFIQTPPPKLITQINQYLYLQCEVIYDEVLDVAFMWTHNGRILKEFDDLRIQPERNYLTVHNVTLLDAGEYECVVKSAVNQISAKTQVIVEGPPGAPGGVSVIDIGKTKALIEWVDGSDNGRPILFYNILGRTNWNRTWINVSEQVQAHEIDRYTGRQRAEVVNLTPWSGYEFSVCAVNDLGIGQPSAPSPIYNTRSDKPYIAPRNVGGGGGKIGDLTITWNPLKSEEQNAQGIYYKVFWRLHGKWEWASQILDKQGNVGIAVIDLRNKDLYYTEYDVKVQAINNEGAGPESEVVKIYSAEDMPQVAPQQVVARSFNSTSLNVTWNPIEMTREKIRGKLIGHRLKYWKVENAEEDATYYLSRTTRNWALIVGLQPDTYYHVKVMAYNAAGEGPESERFIERTYRKAPQKPPSSVFVYGVNPSTVRVIWRYVSPSQEEEPIQGYKVRVWESDQDMTTANDTIVLIGNKLEAYIENLIPGKSYNMRVLAFSNGGDGRMSSPTTRFQMGKTSNSH